MEHKVLTLLLFPINGRERNQLQFLNSRDCAHPEDCCILPYNPPPFFFFLRITAMDLLLGYHPFENHSRELNPTGAVGLT